MRKKTTIKTLILNPFNTISASDSNDILIVSLRVTAHLSAIHITHTHTYAHVYTKVRASGRLRTRSSTGHTTRKIFIVDIYFWHGTLNDIQFKLSPSVSLYSSFVFSLSSFNCILSWLHIYAKFDQYRNYFHWVLFMRIQWIQKCPLKNGHTIKKRKRTPKNPNWKHSCIVKHTEEHRIQWKSK